MRSVIVYNTAHSYFAAVFPILWTLGVTLLDGGVHGIIAFINVDIVERFVVTVQRVTFGRPGD